MKKNNLICIPFIISFLFFSLSAHAQKWTEPQAHRCYTGIKVSVINWGRGSDPNDYFWGVQFISNYDVGVKFKYKLNIGENITDATGGFIANINKKGDRWTNDADRVNALTTHSPSEEWYVYIWDVHFDGMRYGGADNCYADCDKGNDPDNPKPNQLCGLSPSPGPYKIERDFSLGELSGNAGPNTKNDNGGYSGSYEAWMQEGKDIAFTIGKTEDAIFWKKKEGEPPVQFKLIIPGVYRYDMGQDFMMIKFESDDRLSLWNTGNLVGYFKRPGSTKKEVTGEAETKNADVPVIVINNGFWKSLHTAEIKMLNGNIQFRDTRFKTQPFQLYTRYGKNQYRLEGTADDILTVISPTKIGYKADGIAYPDYEFISATEEGTGISATKFNGKWKSDLDRSLNVTLTASNDDEFEYNYHVAGFVKGKANFKREAGNTFSARNKNFMNCFRSVITYITDDRLKIQIYKCNGDFVKEGELYRVGP